MVEDGRRDSRAPLILFGFLVLMVFAIIASVVLALKNPVQEDDSYFSSKRQVDTEINAIIQEQNAFAKKSRLVLRTPNQEVGLKPPYLYRPQDALRISRAAPFTLMLQGQIPKGFRILGHIEKIHSKEPRRSLGQIPLSSPFGLPISEAGRYRLILEVRFLGEAKGETQLLEWESKQAGKQEKRIFFEQELFFR